MPEFSIIVPVYKTEAYLERCISSILQQPFQDYEVILIDDGSPDRCPEICDYYKEIDARVKVIHKQNGGVSSARNAGLAIAEGEFIWFIDSDDYIGADALQRLYEIKKKHRADLYVFSNCHINEEFSGEINTFFEKYYFTYILGFEPWNKLYKRKIIQLNKIQFDIHETIGEDLLFNICYYKSLFEKKREIYFCQEQGFYTYVDRVGSAMHTSSKTRLKQQLRLFDKLNFKMSDILTENNITYLFYLHLIAGIGQASQADLLSVEFAKFDFSKYMKWIKNFDYIKKAFFNNENASKIGKIRIEFFTKLMQNRMYKLAGKVMGLK